MSVLNGVIELQDYLQRRPGTSADDASAVLSNYLKTRFRVSFQ